MCESSNARLELKDRMMYEIDTYGNLGNCYYQIGKLREAFYYILACSKKCGLFFKKYNEFIDYMFMAPLLSISFGLSGKNKVSFIFNLQI